ncbi:MAG: UvrD-helicase domain-containing protein [Tenericutes bacterium]|nr:UvrD-helicase domain-containing protein [Mycoplasmatota bacterium]
MLFNPPNKISLKPRGPHIVIQGLAGTGKSFKIDEIITDKLNKIEIQQRNVLALTFDKKLTKKYHDEYSWSNKENTFNVHSFTFSVLKSLNLLPANFSIKYDDNENLSSADFDVLISKFLKLPNDIIISSEMYSYVKKIKIITIDEIQDFRDDYIEVVKKIIELGEDPLVIIAGDENQKIYAFQDKHSKNKLSEVLKEPNLLFGEEEYENIILNINRRAVNPTFSPFLNGFLKNTGNIDDNLLYKLEENAITGKFTGKPLIKYLKNMDDEYDFLEKELSKIDFNKYTVSILGRSKRNIERYKKLAEIFPKVQISTVHKVKGNGFDYIFYVEFLYNPEEDEGIKTILYTALSRAKRKLFITSSFPKPPVENLNRIFTEGTYDIVVTQPKICRKFPIRKKIEKNTNFGIKKLKGNFLDSFVIKIKLQDCPFTPFVKQGRTVKNKYTSSMRRKTIDGLEFSISFHHGSQQYFFKFKNLNLLKKNKFSDREKIYYCVNEIIQFFDYRIDIENLEIQSKLHTNTWVHLT